MSDTDKNKDKPAQDWDDVLDPGKRISKVDINKEERKRIRKERKESVIPHHPKEGVMDSLFEDKKEDEEKEK